MRGGFSFCKTQLLTRTRDSAGGGGTTTHRQEKIRAKNDKLDENRAKRIEREKAAKDGADAGTNKKQQLEDQSQSIHPSRLARNPLLGN